MIFRLPVILQHHIGLRQPAHLLMATPSRSKIGLKSGTVCFRSFRLRISVIDCEQVDRVDCSGNVMMLVLIPELLLRALLSRMNEREIRRLSCGVEWRGKL